MNKTTYQAFQGLAAAFGPSSDKPGAEPHAVQDAGKTGVQQTEKSATAAARAEGRRPHRSGTSRRSKRVALAARASAPEPIDSPRTTPSPIEGVPQPASPTPPAFVPPEDYTADLIRDAFEGCDSKFPLDAKSAAGGVLVRLQGLCRWQGHFIVKVAAGNQSGSDFFIKKLDAYDGTELITVKSYFRLLVEPERTREGFVVFDARPGAQVKIALKEDRENGRALQLPIRYPF